MSVKPWSVVNASLAPHPSSLEELRGYRDVLNVERDRYVRGMQCDPLLVFGMLGALLDYAIEMKEERAA